MFFRIILFSISYLFSTQATAQTDPVATLRAMEGIWLLDTASYEATYSPKLQIPPMRMECEMTNSSNGLYCTWTVIKDGKDQGIISGDYFAWDSASERLVLLSTEDNVALVSYGTFPEENILRYEVRNEGRVVFEAEMTIGTEKIILHSILHDFQGLTGESELMLYKLN